jgi:hypothetical protein
MIQERLRLIRHASLSQSRYLREANFTSIHMSDLEFLFAAYDKAFFGGLLKASLGRIPLQFRLSMRMTSAGGRTTRRVYRNGDVLYEIAIACGLLFQSFREQDRAVRVCGLDCQSRLEALLRIFEHELVHLIEYLCWRDSDCSAARFQDIASRHFLHRAHKHELITYRERAHKCGIGIGTIVSFSFEGRNLQGRVNRVTKRATILVEDPLGIPYSDGRRYRTYYVPIRALQIAKAASAGPKA